MMSECRARVVDYIDEVVQGGDGLICVIRFRA